MQIPNKRRKSNVRFEKQYKNRANKQILRKICRQQFRCVDRYQCNCTSYKSKYTVSTSEESKNKQKPLSFSGIALKDVFTSTQVLHWLWLGENCSVPYEKLKKNLILFWHSSLYCISKVNNCDNKLA